MNRLLWFVANAVSEFSEKFTQKVERVTGEDRMANYWRRVAKETEANAYKGFIAIKGADVVGSVGKEGR